MSRTVLLKLKEPKSLKDFEAAIAQLGDNPLPKYLIGSSQYIKRHGELVGIFLRNENGTDMSDKIVIDVCPNGLKTSYTSIRDTVLELAYHFPIKHISGDFINQIHGQNGISFSPAVLYEIDERWNEIEERERRVCRSLEKAFKKNFK